MSIITLLTDYGTRDHYVAALKGVILQLAPEVRLVDVSHDVGPQNVAEGAFILRQTFGWFPRGTIHLAVVDPGVGSARRILVGQYAGQYVVVPDNGLVTLVHREFPLEAMHAVEDRRYLLAELSSTFHGRDIMAPVAAHLARGVKPRAFGRAVDRVEALALRLSGEVRGDLVRGTVVHVDHFGTLVTNIQRGQVEALRGGRTALEVRVNGAPVGEVQTCFSDVAVGMPVAYIGSCQLLEIAINGGSAVERFGGTGDVVVEVRAAPVTTESAG